MIEKNNGKRIILTIVFDDLIVLGGGPSALSAAVHTGREAIDTLLVEHTDFGGQAKTGTSSRVPARGGGLGVHFYATCIVPFYKGKQVAVIGGGNSATEEILLLTKYSERVTILVCDRRRLFLHRPDAQYRLSEEKRCTTRPVGFYFHRARPGARRRPAAGV